MIGFDESEDIGKPFDHHLQMLLRSTPNLQKLQLLIKEEDPGILCFVETPNLLRLH